MFSISHSLTIPGDYTNPDFEIQFYWDGNFNQQQQDPQVKINENAFFSIICTSRMRSTIISEIVTNNTLDQMRDLKIKTILK